MAPGTSLLRRDPERRRVHGTELRRLGARIEPLEAMQLPGAKGGRERAVGPVHFLQNQRVGARANSGGGGGGGHRSPGNTIGPAPLPWFLRKGVGPTDQKWGGN